jgi:hypothetical protein
MTARQYIVDESAGDKNAGTGELGKDSWDRGADTGRPGQYGRNRQVGILQPAQERDDRTARTWQQEQLSWERTTGTGKPWQDIHDCTRQLRQDSPDK